MEGVHVSWLWLNIPLMAVFFIAVAGIPLWLVLRRPDFGAESVSEPGRVPEPVAAHYARTRAGSPAQPKAASVRTRFPADAWKPELARAMR
jgi:hypothetical protein